MDRRTFNKLVALGGVQSVAVSKASPGVASAATPAGLPLWPSQTYRRFSVDTHVPDWDPQLLGRFDPAAFIGNIARAGFQSMVQYANSHVGLCLWRTSVGQQHANMHGRDFFGEVVAECRRNN